MWSSIQNHVVNQLNAKQNAMHRTYCAHKLRSFLASSTIGHLLMSPGHQTALSIWSRRVPASDRPTYISLSGGHVTRTKRTFMHTIGHGVCRCFQALGRWLGFSCQQVKKERMLCTASVARAHRLMFENAFECGRTLTCRSIPVHRRITHSRFLNWFLFCLLALT